MHVGVECTGITQMRWVVHYVLQLAPEDLPVHAALEMALAA